MHVNEKWKRALIGSYLIHDGYPSNCRRGAVFQVLEINNLKERLVVTALQEHWPKGAGTCPTNPITYALRNLPKEILQMSGHEQYFHKEGASLVPYDIEGGVPLRGLCTPEELEAFKPDQETNQKGKKTMSMNLKAAAAIVMEDVTTVKLAMGTDTNPQVYTYLIPRKVVARLTEADVEKGVWVVREGTKKNSLAISQIVAVDDTPDIDLNYDTEWKWAFQLIDTSLRDKMVDRTEKLYKQLQDKQRERSQQGILAALGMTKDDLLAIEGK